MIFKVPSSLCFICLEVCTEVYVERARDSKSSDHDPSAIWRRTLQFSKSLPFRFPSIFVPSNFPSAPKSDKPKTKINNPSSLPPLFSKMMKQVYQRANVGIIKTAKTIETRPLPKDRGKKPKRKKKEEKKRKSPNGPPKKKHRNKIATQALFTGKAPKSKTTTNSADSKTAQPPPAQHLQWW